MRKEFSLERKGNRDMKRRERGPSHSMLRCSSCLFSFERNFEGEKDKIHKGKRNLVRIFTDMNHEEIYIYIYRERERERERDDSSKCKIGIGLRKCYFLAATRLRPRLRLMPS